MPYHCGKAGSIIPGEIKNNFMLFLLCEKQTGKKGAAYNKEEYFFHKPIFPMKVLKTPGR
jgi:hypothetical protein